MPDEIAVCRVHPDRLMYAMELCRCCYNRVDGLTRRTGRAKLLPFNAGQRETLLGMGRPSKKMMVRWPHLGGWIVRAREQEKQRQEEDRRV